MVKMGNKKESFMLSLYEYITTKNMTNNVTVTIKGDLFVLRYYTTNKVFVDEHGSQEDEYFQDYGFKTIESITVNDDAENLVKQKGKYVLTQDHFHQLFSVEGDHPLPVHCEEQQIDSGDGYGVVFTIELKEGEEFDIQKLQLIKSDYEVSAYPYWIIARHIIYDGKEIEYDYNECDIEDYQLKTGEEFDIEWFRNN